AGAVSCASPCVLPLVPGYVAFVTGGDSSPEGARKAALPLLLFIAGFTVVYTFIFGFGASSISRVASTADRSAPGRRGRPRVGAPHLAPRDGHALGYGRITVHQPELPMDRRRWRAGNGHDRHPAHQRRLGAAPGTAAPTGEPIHPCDLTRGLRA